MRGNAIRLLLLLVSFSSQTARLAYADCQCRLEAYQDNPGQPRKIETLSDTGSDSRECYRHLISQADQWVRMTCSATHCHYSLGTLSFNGCSSESHTAVKKELACIAYEHGDLTGRSVELGSNQSHATLGSMENEISSAVVKRSCELVVYEYENFRNILARFGAGNYTYFDKRVNDHISSMRCVCK